MDCSTSTAKECATCTVPDPVIKASQAVVNIFVPKVDGQEKYSNVASGIIISEKGRILTYAPVVDRVLDYKIEVHLQNGQSYYAKVEWVDSFSSLAMISVVLKHWESKLPKVQVQYGTTRSVKSGDCVYACGCPAYLKNSLSVGTVSSVNCSSYDIHHLGFRGPWHEYIQTDCVLARGCLGGPMLDMNGKVIGVNTVDINNVDGLSFAVPIDEVLMIWNDMLRYRRVFRPMLGLVLTDLNTKLIQHLKSTRPLFENVKSGIFVNDVPKSLPAFGAGIRPGDVIVEFDGRPVTSIKEIVGIMRSKTNGRFKSFEVKVEGFEDNESKTFTVHSKEWDSEYLVV